MSRSKSVLALLLPVLFVGLAACGDDDGVGPTGPFDLTFAGDATFHGPHGGQEINVLVLGAGGDVVGQDVGTVSADADPAFSFTFEDVLQEGEDHRIHYWIDSNFGAEARPGACDDTELDHQWELQVPDVSEDVALTEEHDAGALTPVCDSFAFDLEFNGDATYQGPHGGQEIEVALVRTAPGSEVVVATRSGTVSDSEDPAFSFSFPGALVRGSDYHVDYWIDSNFGGGTVGACDADDEIDHQWRLEVDEVDADVVIDDDHEAAATQVVCDTFDEGGA